MLTIAGGMAKLKGTSRVVWMGDEECKMLQTLAEAVDLPQTQVLARIVASGLRTLTEQGSRLPLPLKFTLEVPAYEQPGIPASRLNERFDQKSKETK